MIQTAEPKPEPSVADPETKWMLLTERLGKRVKELEAENARLRRLLSTPTTEA